MTIDDVDDDSGDSLASPCPLDKDKDHAVVPPSAAARESLSEVFYISENQSLKALALLSLGLKNSDGMPTFNLAALPWSAALRPTALKMTAKDLRAEIIRRSVAAENVLNAPRPSQWTVPKATEWLEKNPIVAAHEVAFIRATIAHRVLVAERSQLEHAEDANDDRSQVAKGSKWFGKFPHLRLIHAVIDDDNIKAAYIWRLHVPSGRMAVENRRTAEAVQSNVWYMVAEKWNDESFSPTTSVKDSHSDFSWPIPIPFDAVGEFMRATPEKVEEKWNAMNLALKRGIQNWECSGQGDGGYMENDNIDEDDDNDNNENSDGGAEVDDNNTHQFGSLRGRSQRSLDLRRNFFGDKNSYLLYLWDVLEEHGLVQSSMQQLLDGIGSSNGCDGVPSVIGGKSKRDKDDSLASSKKNKSNSLETAVEKLGESLAKHSESVLFASRNSSKEREKDREDKERDRELIIRNKLDERIDMLRDNKRALEIRMLEPQFINNEAALARFDCTIRGIDEEIDMKLAQLNSMIATPTRSNQSPEDV